MIEKGIFVYKFSHSHAINDNNTNFLLLTSDKL